MLNSDEIRQSLLYPELIPLKKEVESSLANIDTTVIEIIESAGNGDSDAQMIVGLMYHTGVSFDQDFNRAKAWYELASGNGEAGGYYSLATMYYYGHSVEKNLSKARNLAGESCDNGEQMGCDIYRELN